MDLDSIRLEMNTDPESFLREYLSGRCTMICGIVPDGNSDCSMAGNTNEPQEDDTYEPEEIGRGQCGRVLRHGYSCALKIAHLDKEESLYNDFEMHTRVQTAFREVKTAHHMDIHVPAVNHLGRTEDQGLGSQLTLLTEFIEPMPYEINEAMIKTLCPTPKEGIDTFLARPDNKHYLPRIHLGHRGSPYEESTDEQSLTLRDFSLHLDELDQLDVNASDFAYTIGQALAVLHWKVGIDGAGVEFVLGEVPLARSEAATALIDNLGKVRPRMHITEGRIGLWLIDFDCCQDFTHDEEGLKRILYAYANGYFSTPHTHGYIDTRVWHYFREVYFEMSEMLIDSRMPAEFIQRIQNQKIADEVGDVMDGLEGLSI